jgi:MOSC domain-containing protein YiiM
MWWPGPAPNRALRSTRAETVSYRASMTSASVVSVNQGPVRGMVVAGKPARSGIDKQPQTGRVAIGFGGLAGDDYGDKVNHGGRDQAVYAYAREDLDWWAVQLGRDLRDGLFGENITTAGLDVTGALIGEVWQLGTAVIQVTAPRIPCVTFQSWLSEPHWVKRFAAARRPGAYLRVLAEGAVGAGDRMVVLSRPEQAVTVAEAMQAYYGDREIMHRLLTVEGRGDRWDTIGASVLSRA